MSLFSCLGILLVSDAKDCGIVESFQFGSITIDPNRCIFAGQVDCRDSNGKTTSLVNVTHGDAYDGSDSDMPTPAFYGIESHKAKQLLNLLADYLSGSIDKSVYGERMAVLIR